MANIKVHKHLPTVADVHVDRPLTNMSEAYFQEETAYLASSCFPIVRVNNQSDKYWIWNRGDMFRDEARVRAPGTEVPRGGARLTTDTYNCLIYEWGGDIPDEVLANTDPGVNLEGNKARGIIQTLLIRRERIFAANFLATSKWSTDITGASVSPSTNEVLKWSLSSSTPIDDINDGRKTILQNTGKEPNTLVLSYDVRLALDTNAQVLARITNGQTPGGPAMISDADLARVFGVQRVLVSKAVYNSVKEGATASMSFISSGKALLCYAEPNPTLDSASAGMTFVWTGAPNMNSFGVQINRQRDSLKYRDVMDGFMNFDQKKTSADLGYFFTGIV